jgi:hypothetical protein
MVGMKITNYKICEAGGHSGREELQSQVCDYIKQGWEPIGGVEVVWGHLDGKWWYYQAVIKREPDAAPAP